MPQTHHSSSWPSASSLRRMGCADTMRTWTHHHIQINGRVVDYRIASSKTARRLRLRVGPNGVDVVQPTGRSDVDVAVFLESNGAWVLDQLRRVARFRGLRRSARRRVSEILFRGEPTRVRVEATETRARGNAIDASGGEIVLRRGANSQTPVARSLETWLRKQARAEIQRHLAIVTTRLRQSPRRVLVMDQRTKWGNCSARKNLSFNWRLILAPDFVLRYLVTHEAVHLAVPDHSAKFWLTVQSLCPETERAKQWLGANQVKMGIDLDRLF